LFVGVLCGGYDRKLISRVDVFFVNLDGVSRWCLVGAWMAKAIGGYAQPIKRIN